MRIQRVFIAVAIAATVGLFTLSATGPGSTAGAGPSPTEQNRSAALAPAGVQLGAVLVGGSEVPGPGDANGWGLADVWVDQTQVCWKITAKAVAPITAAHIHAGPAGVAGPVIVPLDPFNEGCATAPARTTRFIESHPGQFYVNLHNAEFPGGAIRGQLAK